MPLEHWMTFSTFAEQRYFVYPTSSTYRTVLFNANMVAYASDGIAAFLVERTAGLEYVIDPQTHAFQHAPNSIKNSNGEVKSSIRTLAERYGNLIATVAGTRPLSPDDFRTENSADLEEFCECVLAFQNGLASSIAENPSNEKYLEDGIEDSFPRFNVAPYFYLEEMSYKDWLNVNKRCLEVTARINVDRPTWAQIVVSQGVLQDSEARDEIINAYASVSGLRGIILWVDNLVEQQASRIMLSSLVDFLKDIKARLGVPVVNARGGFFSVALGSSAFGELLAGVSHGPEFGESRGVVPVGGGIPIAKFYIPELFSRYKYRDALDLFTTLHFLDSADRFHAEVCECDECIRTINGSADNFVLYGRSNPKEVRRGKGLVRMEFPESETKERCLRHYLERKTIEHRWSVSGVRSKITEPLEKGIEKYQGPLGVGGVAHLEKWLAVLGEI